MKCSGAVLLGLEFVSEPGLGHQECSGIKGISWESRNTLGLKGCSRTGKEGENCSNPEH